MALRLRSPSPQHLLRAKTLPQEWQAKNVGAAPSSVDGNLLADKSRVSLGKRGATAPASGSRSSAEVRFREEAGWKQPCGRG